MAQKSREEGQIGSESREKGDLPPLFPTPLKCTNRKSAITIRFSLRTRNH